MTISTTDGEGLNAQEPLPNRLIKHIQPTYKEWQNTTSPELLALLN